MTISAESWVMIQLHRHCESGIPRIQTERAPIRQAHELVNVLKSGRIVADEDILSFWLARDFQTEDLIAYLSPESIATDQLVALYSREWRYSMGYRDLAFLSYVLDIIKWGRELRAKHGPAIDADRMQRLS